MSSPEGPPAKRSKRDSKYQHEWKASGISPSSRGGTFAHCDVCNTEFNVRHGGINDVKKHLATSKHQQSLSAAESSRNLRGLLRPGQSPIEEAVIRAEVLFAEFISEHNLSFSLANHFTHLTSSMFPDSNIAKAFSSARTKTTCIVKGALSSHFMDPVVDLCQHNPFSILCDEGNDNEDKNFAILVRLWDENLRKPVTRFLDMPVCNIGTGEKLFDLIDESLKGRSIPWSNVVAFESDTTNVMIGKHNSVLSRVKDVQPKVFSQGCVCHLANLCLLAGVQTLPVDVDDFFVDLYYYFDKSAKRKEEFHEFQVFTGVKEVKIIKHCKTRWLSLEKCVQRVLEQWSALYAYFDRISEEDGSARVIRLDQHFKSQLTKLVFYFLEFALDSMCKFNGIFQLSLPMLPSLKAEVNRLLKILLGRFLKLDVIKKVEEETSDFSSINLNDSSLHLPDKDLGIGHKTWGYLTEIEDDIDRRTKKQFFTGVLEFYKAVVSTILKKFSFNDSVVDDVAILLPENRSKVTGAAVLRLARRFPAAVSEDNFDCLEEEVLDYVLASSAVMPSVHKDDGKPTKSEELCKYWQEVGSMKTLQGDDRFPSLFLLAKCLLSLPVSNADTERVFSIVRKIITDYRTEMEQSTLCALLTCKMNCDCPCYELDTPKELLRAAKVATMEYNRAHSSKAKESQ